MTRIRSFGVVSFSKYFALFSALTGLIFGLFSVGIDLLVGMMRGENWNDANPAMAAYTLGSLIGAITIGPLLFGMMGYIFGAFATAFANVALKLNGGLEVEVEVELESKN